MKALPPYRKHLAFLSILILLLLTCSTLEAQQVFTVEKKFGNRTITAKITVEYQYKLLDAVNTQTKLIRNNETIDLKNHSSAEINFVIAHVSLKTNATFSSVYNNYKILLPLECLKDPAELKIKNRDNILEIKTKLNNGKPKLETPKSDRKFSMTIRANGVGSFTIPFDIIQKDAPKSSVSCQTAKVYNNFSYDIINYAPPRIDTTSIPKPNEDLRTWYKYKYGGITAWCKYLSHTSTPYAVEATELLNNRDEELWLAIVDQNSLREKAKQAKVYINAFQNDECGNYTALHLKKAKELIKDQEKLQEEKTAWEKVDKNRINDYRVFMKKYPDSDYFGDAEIAIVRLSEIKSTPRTEVGGNCFVYNLQNLISPTFSDISLDNGLEIIEVKEVEDYAYDIQICMKKTGTFQLLVADGTWTKKPAFTIELNNTFTPSMREDSTAFVFTVEGGTPSYTYQLYNKETDEIYWENRTAQASITLTHADLNVILAERSLPCNGDTIALVAQVYDSTAVRPSRFRSQAILFPYACTKSHKTSQSILLAISFLLAGIVGVLIYLFQRRKRKSPKTIFHD